MAHPARAHVQIGWRAIFTTEHQIGSVPARAGERACFARVLLMPFEHTHEIARAAACGGRDRRSWSSSGCLLDLASNAQLAMLQIDIRPAQAE